MIIGHGYINILRSTLVCNYLSMPNFNGGLVKLTLMLIVCWVIAFRSPMDYLYVPYLISVNRSRHKLSEGISRLYNDWKVIICKQGSILWYRCKNREQYMNNDQAIYFYSEKDICIRKLLCFDVVWYCSTLPISACRRCSIYIFILDLTSGFKGFGNDSRKTSREFFKCWDLVRLILETWRYNLSVFSMQMACNAITTLVVKIVSVKLWHLFELFFVSFQKVFPTQTISFVW